jgi:hypothetical protein
MASPLLSRVFLDAVQPKPAREYPYFEREIPDIPTYFNLPIYNNPIGIEVEIEKWNGDLPPLYCWRPDEDGSLKDSGLELISYPLYGTYIDLALYELKEFYETCPNTDFSHRCSIHVHVNVSTFTKSQLLALIGLYAIYERSLFEFVEQLRRGNSFCYPLVGTDNQFQWHTNTKYCAFNWMPIRKQMTVEYRHLEGTKDIKKIRRWVALVTKLTNHALALDAQQAANIVTNIISEEQGVAYAENVFGNTATLLTDLQKSVDYGAMWALTFLENSKEN